MRSLAARMTLNISCLLHISFQYMQAKINDPSTILKIEFGT